MKILKNLRYFTFLTLIILAACNNSEDTPQPVDVTDSTEVDAVTCKITAQNRADGFNTTFTYNDQNLLIKSVSSDGSGEENTRTFEYDSEGRLTKLVTIFKTTNSTETRTREFTWSRDNLASSTLKRDLNGSIIGETAYTYTYDDQNRISKINTSLDDGANTSEETIYSYDANSNLIKEEYTQTSNLGTFTSTTDYSDFDDKKNIFGTESYKSAYPDRLVSVNNALKKSFSSSSGFTSETTLSNMEYNEEGYPTKYTETYTSSSSSTPDVSNYTLTWECK